MKSVVLTVFVSVWCLCLIANPGVHKHVVKKGETLYSISREYDLKLADLLRANPTMAKSKNLHPGQQLIIPHAKSIASVHVITAHANNSVPVKPEPVPSTPGVQYRDEDEYSKTNTQAVKATASVMYETPAIEKHETMASNSFSIKTGSANASDYAGLFGQYAAHGYNVLNNTGEANYLAENTSGNPYLALYNDAEIGSVIKVVNMLNKKTLYVKVIGRLSSADASREIILKLSHQAAAEIGASDDKFLVEVAGIKQ